jgi:RNA polymerase sigma factor (sigma-70 family)
MSAVMDESLEAWFAREILTHEDALVRYLCRMWSDRDEVHDLRQETYIRVYEAAGKARPHSPKAFLFTTARHLLADRIRRERVVSIETRGDIEALDVLIDEISPEDRASAHEELRTVARAFERLPPRCREVLWLRRVEDLSQKEVAARLSIREGMVEKHVAKAMRRFADALFGGRRMRSTRKTRAEADGEHEHVDQQTD